MRDSLSRISGYSPGLVLGDISGYAGFPARKGPLRKTPGARAPKTNINDGGKGARPGASYGNQRYAYGFPKPALLSGFRVDFLIFNIF